MTISLVERFEHVVAPFILTTGRTCLDIELNATKRTNTQRNNYQQESVKGTRKEMDENSVRFSRMCALFSSPTWSINFKMSPLRTPWGLHSLVYGDVRAHLYSPANIEFIHKSFRRTYFGHGFHKLLKWKIWKCNSYQMWTKLFVKRFHIKDP